MDIEVGDKVKVVCKDVACFNDENATKTFIGRVKSVFNAFDKEGDRWVYELVGPTGNWFLYKPYIDGGTISIIEKAKN